MSQNDPFQARASLEFAGGRVDYFDIGRLEQAGLGRVDRLPYALRVLLEGLVRNVDGFSVTEQNVRELIAWQPRADARGEVPFLPGRVVLQDFTGVPCVVDLAAMRDAMRDLGGSPRAINPEVPCDLVVDHSVQVDAFATPEALRINAEREFERNRERYEFLKWGQQSLDQFRVVPPATGIVHQVNLEYLAQVVLRRERDGGNVAFPDSLVGTDSHTTMINGLGVLGWGVGGIEAEGVMLGQPIYLVMPDVVGVRLVGKLPAGATATDLVLTLTEMLRRHGVVDKFVEYTGEGIADLGVADRATIANMAPEYGATTGFFPVDARTIEFLRFTGRDDELVDLVERYCRANRLFWTPDAEEPEYADVLELDLGTVRPSLAGPKRPQDRVILGDMQAAFRKALVTPPGPQGLGVDEADVGRTAEIRFADGSSATIGHGAVVIAAITSCTNTSNPDLMIAAGLLAQKAHEAGLTRKPWVKTSLAPGSKVVTDYLERAGLLPALEALGFHVVGYGCTTCIGNSGPLPDEVAQAIRENGIAAASVLSGNRNFEGRVHPLTRANYLASPPLVVAYALAGTVDIDLENEPLGTGADGRPVFLRDIWPSPEEVTTTRTRALTPEQYRERYRDVFHGNPMWNAVPVSESELYPWNPKSTYIQKPPFFDGMGRTPEPPKPIRGARVLALLGDSVTTDHISPAGPIPPDSPAGRYLIEHGVDPKDFNSYGSRRGNDRVMTRGTFANVRVRNRLAEGREGGWTKDFSKAGGGKITTIFEASEHYRAEGTPLVVLAGRDYGMGSSRDWAAKGTLLLGVRAVIAQSFERIHRSNLVGMGVLPLTFPEGQNADTLGLDGSETFDIELPEELTPRMMVPVTAARADGRTVRFDALCRIDTPVEVEYFRHGGILQAVLRRKLD
ncbi:MAG: aconitate hydratase AcnA [Acidobacteriota bacterium]